MNTETSSPKWLLYTGLTVDDNFLLIPLQRNDQTSQIMINVDF